MQRWGLDPQIFIISELYKVCFPQNTKYQVPLFWIKKLKDQMKYAKYNE
jgi:hypothetical protein